MGENHLGKAVFAAIDFAEGDRIVKFTGRRFRADQVPSVMRGGGDRFVQVTPDHYMGPSGRIDDLINLVGVDQVLYGSDWPHPEGLAEPTHYVTALEHLSVDDQAKIMGGNLGRLVTV